MARMRSSVASALTRSPAFTYSSTFDPRGDPQMISARLDSAGQELRDLLHLLVDSCLLLRSRRLVARRAGTHEREAPRAQHHEHEQPAALWSSRRCPLPVPSPYLAPHRVSGMVASTGRSRACSTSSMAVSVARTESDSTAATIPTISAMASAATA